MIAALGNGAIIVCSVQSAASETASEKGNAESDHIPFIKGGENEGLFENDSAFPDKSAYLTDQKELYYRVLLAILFVVVLGAAAIYVSRKLLPQLAGVPGKEIRVIETLHLGPRKAVHLIEIGNRRFLIGSTNENVTKLADITHRFPDISSQEITVD